MKKVLSVLILLAVAAVAYAQYATPSLAERKGCTIKIDDQKLSKTEAEILMSNIDGVDYSADWAKARDWRTAGISMIAGGGGVVAVGLTTVLIGAVTSAVGAATGAIAGTIVGSVGGEEAASQTGQEAAKNGANAGVPIMNVGGIIALVGALIHVAGIPITAVNATKMGKLVDKYNDSLPSIQPENEVLLSFGATVNGIGLCLTF